PVLPSFWHEAADAAWLSSQARPSALIRPIEAHDRRYQWLQASLGGRRERYEELARELQRLNESRKSRLDDKRDRARMNEERTRLNQSLSSARADLRVAEAFMSALDR